MGKAGGGRGQGKGAQGGLVWRHPHEHLEEDSPHRPQIRLPIGGTVGVRGGGNGIEVLHVMGPNWGCQGVHALMSYLLLDSTSGAMYSGEPHTVSAKPWGRVRVRGSVQSPSLPLIYV